MLFLAVLVILCSQDEVDGEEEVDGVSGEGSSEDLKPVESKLDPKVQVRVIFIFWSQKYFVN